MPNLLRNSWEMYFTWITEEYLTRPQPLLHSNISAQHFVKRPVLEEYKDEHIICQLWMV